MRRDKKTMLKQYFTLIEMLLVIGVVGIMLGIGASILFASGQGGAVKQSTVSLGAKLSTARALAQTKRIYTAVVFPVDDAMPNQYGSRSMIIVEVTPVAGARYFRYQLKDMISGQGWTFLPPGVIMALGQAVEPEQPGDNTTPKPKDEVVLSPLKANTLMAAFDQSPEAAGTPRALAYAPSRSQIYDIPNGTPCIVFRPGGQLDLSTFAHNQTLYVAEGSVTSGNVKVKKGTQYRQIFLNPFTGKVQYEF